MLTICFSVLVRNRTTCFEMERTILMPSLPWEGFAFYDLARDFDGEPGGFHTVVSTGYCHSKKEFWVEVSDDGDVNGEYEDLPDERIREIYRDWDIIYQGKWRI